MEGAALRVGLPRAALRWRGRVGPSARFAALPNGVVWRSWRGNRRKAGSVSTPADVAAEYEPATKQKKGSVDGSPAEGLAARSLSFRDRSNFSNHAPGSRLYPVSAPSRTVLKSATISNGSRRVPLVPPALAPGRQAIGQGLACRCSGAGSTPTVAEASAGMRAVNQRGPTRPVPPVRLSCPRARWLHSLPLRRERRSPAPALTDVAMERVGLSVGNRPRAFYPAV